jgi:hypothetical protein
VLHGSVARSQPFACFGRLIVKRTYSSAIGDVPTFVDDVNPFRPRGVSAVGGVAHIIDPKGQGKLESFGEVIRDGHALFQLFWLRITNIIFYVGFHLPFVGRMRLAHVDGQKIRVILVVVIDLNDVANLAAKRRSSKAAEHQNQRARPEAFADVKTARTVKRHQPRIRGVASNFQRAAMHVRQGITHHVVNVLRTACHVRKHAECCDEQHR